MEENGRSYTQAQLPILDRVFHERGREAVPTEHSPHRPQKRQRLADAWESLYRRRLTASQARRVIADITQEIIGENVAGETVAAYLKRWHERKAVETSESTAYAYKSVADSFAKHFGERAGRMYLDEVTAAHVAAWRDARAKDRAPATTNIALKILRIAFQDALRESLVISPRPMEF